MEISEATPIDPRIKKEQIFLKNIKKIEELDKLVTDISDLYDQGLSDIAYLRFKNQIFGNSLSASSYTEGPSLRFIEINENEGYKIVEANEQFLLSEDSQDKEILEEIEENEKTGLLDENELLEVKTEEKILCRFGISVRDPIIYHAQRAFLQCVEKLIQLKNEYNRIGVYQKNM